MNPAAPFDRALHRRRRDRAARGLRVDFLHRRAAADLAERLTGVRARLPTALALGGGDLLAAALAETPEAAAKIDTLVQADLSLPRLGGAGPRVQADEERLPFAPASFDLIASVLALHWTNALPVALLQARRALRPGGLFLAAVLGGATLTELRQALLAAEAEVTGGAAARVSPMLDAPDGAALLQRAGFADPVADVDRVTVRYASPLALIADLRAMGETAAFADRSPPLTRAMLARMAALYAERFAGPDGRVPATFEIVTLTGWAPA